MKINTIAIMLVALLLLTGCIKHNKANQECKSEAHEIKTDSIIGVPKYAFIDKNGCLHLKRKCVAFGYSQFGPFLEEGREFTGQIYYARLDTLSEIGLVCAECVDVDKFEYLDSLTKTNKQRQASGEEEHIIRKHADL